MDYAESDNYLYDNDVFINKFGIKDKNELEKVEGLIVAKNSLSLCINPVQDDFSIKHLQEIHRCLFGELYEWAGKLRHVDIYKAGVLFVHTNRILPEFEKLHRQIKSELQKNLVSKEYVILSWRD